MPASEVELGVIPTELSLVTETHVAVDQDPDDLPNSRCRIPCYCSAIMRGCVGGYSCAIYRSFGFIATWCCGRCLRSKSFTRRRNWRVGVLVVPNLLSANIAWSPLVALIMVALSHVVFAGFSLYRKDLQSDGMVPLLFSVPRPSRFLSLYRATPGVVLFLWVSCVGLALSSLGFSDTDIDGTYGTLQMAGITGAIGSTTILIVANEMRIYLFGVIDIHEAAASPDVVTGPLKRYGVEGVKSASFLMFIVAISGLGVGSITAIMIGPVCVIIVAAWGLVASGFIAAVVWSLREAPAEEVTAAGCCFRFSATAPFRSLFSWVTGWYGTTFFNLISMVASLCIAIYLYPSLSNQKDEVYPWYLAWLALSSIGAVISAWTFYSQVIETQPPHRQ